MSKEYKDRRPGPGAIALVERMLQTTKPVGSARELTRRMAKLDQRIDRVAEDAKKVLADVFRDSAK